MIGSELQFDRRWVTRYSWPNRIPYHVWEKGVPRVHDRFANCVVYVYPTLADAQRGEKSGGSGFLVAVLFTENPEYGEVYVLTNFHVIRDYSTPVVRINRNDGTVEYFETLKRDWIHPNSDDVAAIPFQPVSWDDLKIQPILSTEFLDRDTVRNQDVGIGDDVFMIGRFINQDGKQQNVPTIRFGNIAMMPSEVMQCEGGISEESFLIEIKSLPGYSGSPVFLYSVTSSMDFSNRKLEEEEESFRKAARDRTSIQDPLLDAGGLAYLTPKGPYLLGIDYCHLHTREKVRTESGSPLSEGWIVQTNSGMAGVIPCWKIAELLDCEELVEMRKEQDRARSKIKSESGVTLDLAEKETSFTQPDFEADLRKATRRIEPLKSDEETK